MVILEECEDEDKKSFLEYEYINKYLTAFLGFNQLNTISLYADYENKGKLSEFYLDNVKYDIKNVIKYSSYGYNLFNTLQAKELFEVYEGDLYKDLNNILEFKNIITLSEQARDYSENKRKLIHYIMDTSKDECTELCSNIINSFFTKNNLKSEDKKKQIIDYLLFENDKDKKEVIKYIQRFSVEKNEDVFSVILKKYKNEITKIRKKINEYQEKIYEYEEKIINSRLVIFKDIIPNREYISFPLKDTYFSDKINPSDEDNVLYINIDFSNHGKKRMSDNYPCILKVNYLYKKDNKVSQKTCFINSVFDNFFENNDQYYINGGMYGIVNDPFNIWRYSETCDYTTISTSMEYYNGINEFTLVDKEKYKFSDVIQEIDSIINEDTKVIYNSGCKTLIKDYDYLDSIVINKIIKQLKK